MAEKKSHLPHEVAFGGAIPKHIADEFKAIVADAGWSHKRALAAAVMMFVREARSAERLADTRAVGWYHEVGAVARGEQPVSSGGEGGDPPPNAGRRENIRTQVAKAVAAKREQSSKAPQEHR